MGALPIVLALSGFVLLWAIVNYNSFTDKRSTIQRMLGQQKDLLRERTDLLARMAALFRQHHLALPEHFNELINKPDKLSSKPLMEKALSEMAAVTKTGKVLLNADELKSLKTNLVDNTNQLLKLQHTLTALVASYNKQTTSMPYRIIAALFGFKPVSL